MNVGQYRLYAHIELGRERRRYSRRRNTVRRHDSGSAVNAERETTQHFDVQLTDAFAQRIAIDAQ